MRQLRQDKILRDVLGLGQGERGLARLGLVSLETVLAQLIEEPVGMARDYPPTYDFGEPRQIKTGMFPAHSR